MFYSGTHEDEVAWSCRRNSGGRMIQLQASASTAVIPARSLALFVASAHRLP